MARPGAALVTLAGVALGLSGAACGTTVTAPPSATDSVPSHNSSPSAQPSLSAMPTAQATAAAAATLVIAPFKIQIIVPSGVGNLNYSITPAQGSHGLVDTIAFTTSDLNAAWQTTCAVQTAELVQVSVYTQNPGTSGVEFQYLSHVGSYWFAQTQNDFADGCPNTTTSVAAQEIPEVDNAMSQAVPAG